MREVTLVVGARRMGRSVTEACIALDEGSGLILVREPNNPSDANAIRLLDIFGRPVGYVQRKVATVVAKWMDEGFLVSGKCTRAAIYIGYNVAPRGVYMVYKYPRAAIYREDPLAEKSFITRKKRKNKRRQFEIVE